MNDTQECKRHRVTMKDGTRFYFMIGETFIQCVAPFENRPENLKTRMILDSFCEAVSAIMEKNYRQKNRR